MQENINHTFIEMITTRIIVDFTNKNGEEDTKLVKNEKLNLKNHEGMPYLTLQDISQQLTDVLGSSITIDVWYELGLNGYIYRYNSENRSWTEHGSTRGFA